MAAEDETAWPQDDVGARSALLAWPDPLAVLRGTFLPTVSFDSAFLATLVAILGTTISPYLFFWQAAQEVECEMELARKTVAQRRGASDAELAWASTDVRTGMFFSNLVMYFIILTSAATLHAHGHKDIETARQASEAPSSG